MTYSILRLFKKAYSWWWHGLVACLPELWRRNAKHMPTVLGTIDGATLTLEVSDKKGGQANQFLLDCHAETAGDALLQWLKPYKNYDIVIELDEAHYLHTSFSLPAQAKDNLDQIIQFEIDRQTPFSADQVYYGYHVDDHNNKHSVLVSLVVVPKSFVADLQNFLTDTAMRINRLLIETQPDRIEIIVSESAKKSARFSHINTWLAGSIIVLILAVLYKPILYYEHKIKAIEAPLATLKKQTQQVHQLQSDNAAILKHIQFLDIQQTRYQSRLALLNELARVLPVHTWLEQLSINDPQLTIQGESASASDLIGLLTDSAYLTDVRFSAPTTLDNRSGKTRFKIQATIVSGKDNHGS